MFGRKGDPLDAPLMYWNALDYLTMRELLDGGLVCLARPGGGKTSSIGKLLARAILKYPRSGGLICSSSPTDLKLWQGLFKEARRENDLILFGPAHAHRFNYTDYLVRLGLDPKGIAKEVTVTGERQDNDQAKSGGAKDDFWPLKMSQEIGTAVGVIKLATGKASIPDIQEFISGAAHSADDLIPIRIKNNDHTSDDRVIRELPSKYSQGKQWEFFQKAQENCKTDIEHRDLLNAQNYWWSERPVMNERTRTSIEAGITAILNVFLSGEVWSLLSRDTTITPEVMKEGKWVFVDASVGQYDSSGAFILNAWRSATQRMIRQRDPDNWDSPIICWADEASKIVNSGDVYHLTESRKFGGASVYLAQSVNSFHSAFPGDRGKAMAELMLGCFNHKVIMACDPDTAEYGQKYCGRRIRISKTFRPPNQLTFAERLWKGFAYDISGAEHVENVVEAKEFMHNLRTGGPRNAFLCDGLVLRTGECFHSNRENHIHVTFSQR